MDVRIISLNEIDVEKIVETYHPIFVQKIKLKKKV